MAGAAPDPLEHVGLVKAIARFYRGRGLEPEDLVQEGLLGLLRACQRYDGRGGTPFPAFAALVIRRAIGDATIAQAFPVRLPYHRHRRLRRTRARGGVPRAMQETGPGGRGTPLADLAVAPAEGRAEADDRARLRAAVDALPPRERVVIRLRYGLRGGPPRTLAEVGAATGRSRQLIQQWEARALRRLRRALGPDAIG